MALRRAAHQLYDRPLVFDDPLAVAILGAEFSEDLRRTPQRADRPSSVALRAFLVARSRFAEDTLGAAVVKGATQYVLLGAGLDTFAYRNPYADLRVFEVDHPATQHWKRGLLGRGGIDVPGSMTYVPVDFERQSLAEQIAAAGFDALQPTVFAWLGVVPYLSLQAFRSTLGVIQRSTRGSALVMDYGLPRAVLPPREQMERDSLAQRVELAGEPFRLLLTPAEVAQELSAFSEIEDLGSTEINALYFEGRVDMLRVRGTGGRFVRAWL